MSKTSIWIFRFALIIGSPLTFLVLLEITLRLSGFGYPTSYFLPQENNTLGTNTKFSWRFFDPKIARIPEAITIVPQKPTNTKRIFVLGGSAAQGVPHAAFSFPRILEVMLDNAYPEKIFEIHNVAMTAINSHVVLPIARECAELDPDLFIVYMGNNEVVGPYGPGSVITAFQPNLSLIRLSVWANATKTGQLLSEIIGKFWTDTASPKQWTGMDIFVDKHVTSTDPRLKTVYSHFQSNLRDIIKIGRKSGAPVLVSTVASNIHDLAPFASQHSENLSESALQLWQSAFDEALREIQRENYSKGLALIEQSESVYQQHALLAYEKALSYENLGQLKHARAAYIQARNLDTLRFRTDTAINEKIRETVQDFSDEQVVLLDAENLFGGTSDSTESIAGYDDFFEHVHLTFEGNYKLAKAMFKQLPAVLSELTVIKESDTPTLQTCAVQLAWNSWGKIQQLDGILPLVHRPPFTTQEGHEQRMVTLKKQLNQYTAELRRDNGKGTIESLKNALKKRSDDPYLHQLLGELYYSMNRYDDALKHINTVLELLPTSHDAFMQIAYIYFRSGKVEKSLPYFRRAIELSPYYSQTRVDLASALAHLKRFEEAEEICKQLTQEQPEEVALQFGYGYVLLQAEKIESAEKQLLKAFSLDPNAFHLRQLVDSKLQAAGRQSTTREFDRLFIQAQPDRDKAYGQLVDYYVSLKDFTSAKYYQRLRDEMEADGK